MWSKRNTSPLLVGMQIGTTTLESSMMNSQKIGNHSSSRPSHTTLGHSSTMFIAELFVIARTWKQPGCPSTEEWIRKMWYIYTMEYYAAEKNNDIMKFAGKWMELENVILSKPLTVGTAVSLKEKSSELVKRVLKYHTKLQFQHAAGELEYM
ncbi:hypothetical protein STEG23_019449 [Scotinomys teguina]